MHTSKIAVIGGGVAGIVAAHLLQRQHSVTLYEANDYLGGHTNTVTVPTGPDAGVGIDTGFIVLNDWTYPNFHRFLAELGVGWRYSDMCFSFHCRESGLQYGSSNFDSIFAQRRNLLNLPFLKMLRDVQRFWRVALTDLESNAVQYETLREFLTRHRLTGRVMHDYIVPISAAIWSSSNQEILDFPARTFLHFYRNHGLLAYLKQPRWQTVVGGSSAYVAAFRAQFSGQIRLATPVQSLRRDDLGVDVIDNRGECERFDRVVIAAHADQALTMLEAPSPLERELLGCWRYNLNRTVLHTDPAFLPPTRRAWASWNYSREPGEHGSGPVSVTYHMNRLQGLRCAREYCVTLNPRREIEAERIVKAIDYTHPVFTVAALRSQERLCELNGQQNTWFCGSYFCFGFHEDAVRSGLAVANSINGQPAESAWPEGTAPATFANRNGNSSELS